MSSSTSLYPDEIIPHDHDIKCGRGKGPRCHPGNIFLRETIIHFQQSYRATGYHFVKGLIAKSIMNIIESRDPPGRFIEESHDNKRGTFYWKVVSRDMATKKVKQALRDSMKWDTNHGADEISGSNLSGLIDPEILSVLRLGIRNAEDGHRLNQLILMQSKKRSDQKTSTKDLGSTSSSQEQQVLLPRKASASSTSVESRIFNVDDAGADGGFEAHMAPPLKSPERKDSRAIESRWNDPPPNEFESSLPNQSLLLTGNYAQSFEGRSANRFGLVGEATLPALSHNQQQLANRGSQYFDRDSNFHDTGQVRGLLHQTALRTPDLNYNLRQYNNHSHNDRLSATVNDNYGSRLAASLGVTGSAFLDGSNYPMSHASLMNEASLMNTLAKSVHHNRVAGAKREFTGDGFDGPFTPNKRRKQNAASMIQEHLQQSFPQSRMASAQINNDLKLLTNPRNQQLSTSIPFLNQDMKDICRDRGSNKSENPNHQYLHVPQVARQQLYNNADGTIGVISKQDNQFMRKRQYSDRDNENATSSGRLTYDHISGVEDKQANEVARMYGKEEANLNYQAARQEDYDRAISEQYDEKPAAKTDHNSPRATMKELPNPRQSEEQSKKEGSSRPMLPVPTAEKECVDGEKDNNDIDERILFCLSNMKNAKNV